jgi:type IV secretory pathway VirD2 relaxase
MPKLRELFDAAKAADGKVTEILNRMTAAFDTETEEGTAEAMGMREQLSMARAEADQANLDYITARDVQAEADEHARKFVPAGDGAQKTDSKQITRATYEAMDYAERHTYLKNGGAIVDHLDE